MHDTGHALWEQNLIRSTCSKSGNETTCMECLKPFQILENIKAEVGNMTGSIERAIEEDKQKIKTFMGHKIRA